MNADFTFTGYLGPNLVEAPKPTATVTIGTPVNVAQPALDKWRNDPATPRKIADSIRARFAVPQFKGCLDAIEDVELRAAVRKELAEWWEAQKKRLKREALGKRSDAGDTELAKLSELARRL